MTHSQRESARLLELARAVLAEEIGPALPQDTRYGARMVANAMAIAAREMIDGEVTARAERAALAELYEEPPTPPGRADAESLDEALTRLNWWLVAEIRAGRRDGDARVHALLRQAARARLRLANPKALPDDDQ
jgi:hypothetical protein